MLSLKQTWAVWTVFVALLVVAVGQIALAQGVLNPPASFNNEYVERAAKHILPEVKAVSSGGSEFTALVDSFSQEERDTQIKRILPLDRGKLNLNPLELVPFTLQKAAVKLYLPDKAVLRSSSLQALIRGNGKLIAPMGVVQVGDKFFPVTLQGEAYAPGGKIYLSLYDNDNKVVAMFAFPQEITIAAASEVLLIHGPDDRFSPEYVMYFTTVVMLNIAAFLMN